MKQHLKFLKLGIKYTHEKINVIVTQYAMSIILHRRRKENNKPLPIVTLPP